MNREMQSRSIIGKNDIEQLRQIQFEQRALQRLFSIDPNTFWKELTETFELYDDDSAEELRKDFEQDLYTHMLHRRKGSRPLYERWYHQRQRREYYQHSRYDEEGYRPSIQSELEHDTAQPRRRKLRRHRPKQAV